MRLINVCKRPVLAACFALISLQVTAKAASIEEQKANKTISQIYHNLGNKPILDMPARITNISAQFLGKTYLLGALGEGVQGDYDQSPLYRTDAFDCETFVDTVLALALANAPDQFNRCINQVRYHKGQVSFINRNHFTCLDWNRNNQRQGFVKDITTSLRGEHNQTIVQFARALIDKPAWYSHMSTSAIRLDNISSVEQEKRLKSLKLEGAQLLRATSIIPYIPLTILFDSTGKANQYIFDQIPNAAIIEIIRPNWDLSHEIGTHLNVSHLGFAIREKDTLLFREASSAHGQVVDVSLITYLQDALKSPTIKGINIQVVLPQKDNTMSCVSSKSS